jgi:hypothetical protein
MHAVAIFILCIAAAAWLAPAARAFINRKPRIGIIALATGPVALALYAQDKDPNVAMAAVMAVIVIGCLLWRHTGK